MKGVTPILAPMHLRKEVDRIGRLEEQLTSCSPVLDVVVLRLEILIIGERNRVGIVFPGPLWLVAPRTFERGQPSITSRSSTRKSAVSKPELVFCTPMITRLKPKVFESENT